MDKFVRTELSILFQTCVDFALPFLPCKTEARHMPFWRGIQSLALGFVSKSLFSIHNTVFKS